jgi:hypothetical protein
MQSSNNYLNRVFFLFFFFFFFFWGKASSTEEKKKNNKLNFFPLSVERKKSSSINIKNSDKKQTSGEARIKPEAKQTIKKPREK